MRLSHPNGSLGLVVGVLHQASPGHISPLSDRGEPVLIYDLVMLWLIYDVNMILQLTMLDPYIRSLTPVNKAIDFYDVNIQQS